MTVTLSPRHDSQIQISSALGFLETELADLKITAPFQFVLAALKKFRPHLRSGLDIKIESEFSDQIGFASSAAVTVAMVAALQKLLRIEGHLIQEARAIVRKVQGLGSGADVAACALGGIVAYKMRPFYAEKIPHLHPITAVYAGYKTPTVEVVRQVQNTFSKQPKLFKQLCQAINTCALQGAQHARDQDWQSLGKIMNAQQGLLEALGVNTLQLSIIIENLRAQSGVLGAKISGSGLGDCVIALGSVEHFNGAGKEKLIPVAMTAEGVRCEEI